MVLAATTVWEVRTTGNDNNGGGFNDQRSWSGVFGTDRSRQNAPHVVIDGTSVVATLHPTLNNIIRFTSGYVPTGADVGNLVRITGGAATPGVYEITSFDSAQMLWGMDRAAGTAGSTVLGRMGGALASPGGLGRDLASNGVNGMKAWIKSGTYTLTSSTANIPGGRFLQVTNQDSQFEGYETIRGDLGAKPVISAGAISGITIFTVFTSVFTNYRVTARNIKVDGNSQANVTGFNIAIQNTVAELCEAESCTTGIVSGNPASVILNCRAINCGTGFNGGAHMIQCRAVGCTTGFLIAGNNGITFLDCVASGGTTAFSMASNWAGARGCIAYGSSGDGFSGGVGTFVECSAIGCGGFGFNAGTSLLVRCAGFSNTSGNYNAANTRERVAFLDLTANPFANAPGGDFNINNVSGGGAVLRAVQLAL